MRVLLKREDLTHTGSHKINNVIGQALLTRRMGKTRLIAETGAGQHGVATATAAALFGLECTVYMGEVDVERQALNVFRMKLLGAEVRAGRVGQPHAEGRHQRGHAGLGGHGRDHPLLPRLGDGPAPVPVDGAGVPADHRRRGRGAVPGPASTAPTPTCVVACVGGGRTPPAPSPASSTPTPAWSASSPPAAPPSARGVPGVVHGLKSFLSRTSTARSLEAHSISAGLDYPGVGPEHAHLAVHRPGPLRRRPTTPRCSRPSSCWPSTEGIIPALEPAHALAWVVRAAGTDELPAGSTVLVTLSGRGDKDVAQVMHLIDSEYAERAVGPLEAASAAARDAGRKLLVPYVTGGLGADWIEVRRRRSPAAGADAIEIGIPFSDPVMDGPTIQEASRAGARRGGHARRASSTALGGVDAGVPLVAMTYYNIVFRAGHRRFARSLADQGVGGAIVPDLPLEELAAGRVAADDAGVETVLLAAPTDPDERLAAHLRAVARLRLRRRPDGRHRRAAGAGRRRRTVMAPAAQGGHRQAGAHRLRRVDPGSRRSRLAAEADGVIVGLGPDAPPARRRGPRRRRRLRGRAAGRPRRRLRPHPAETPVVSPRLPPLAGRSTACNAIGPREVRPSHGPRRLVPRTGDPVPSNG